MFIKEIFIQNFKGFEKETFKFRSLFTVAIGNNAMGKSSLLHAIQVALGGYLQCLDIPGSKNNRRQFINTKTIKTRLNRNRTYRIF